MKIEVSGGELVDKYSVLCLKAEKIQDASKRENVLYEKNMIHPHVMQIIEPWFLYYKLLHQVNRQIWDMTNNIKELDMEKEPYLFAKLALQIFQCNDRRFRMKRIFNLHSQVKEQKSYDQKTITIFIPDECSIFKKLNTLIYLVVEYDHIYIECKCKEFEMLCQFIPACCLSKRNNMENEMIMINDILIPEQDEHLVKIIHHFTILHM